MAEFMANNIHNEITGEMFRRVVQESKLDLVLRPRLLKLDELTARLVGITRG